MIYFTADTHFFHKGIIGYCNRPFKNTWAMNAFLVEKWNEIVTNNDIVYHLGDFAFGKIKEKEEIVEQLRGKKIYLIPGGHDKRISFGKINLLPPIADVSIEGQHIVLCHYCMRVWNKSHYGSWHLYGHFHGRLESIGKSLDVGVDGHNFYPWSFMEVVNYMSSQPNNTNYIEQGR